MYRIYFALQYDNMRVWGERGRKLCLINDVLSVKLIPKIYNGVLYFEFRELLRLDNIFQGKSPNNGALRNHPMKV